MNDIIKCDEQIGRAAKQVFLEKGFEKAKMQDIADAAGMSRTALNYYFRTKENLFYLIADQLFDGLIPRFETVLEQHNQSAQERIESIVDVFNGFLRQNSDVPYFVICEINRNPKLLHGFIQNSKRIRVYLLTLRQLLESAQKPNSINSFLDKPIEEIITIVYGLMFTPYLISPLVNQMYGEDAQRIETYYSNHAENVKGFLKKLLLN